MGVGGNENKNINIQELKWRMLDGREEVGKDKTLIDLFIVYRLRDVKREGQEEETK